jgi:hypothetical protein
MLQHNGRVEIYIFVLYYDCRVEKATILESFYEIDPLSIIPPKMMLPLKIIFTISWWNKAV